MGYADDTPLLSGQQLPICLHGWPEFCHSQRNGEPGYYEAPQAFEGRLSGSYRRVDHDAKECQHDSHNDEPHQHQQDVTEEVYELHDNPFKVD